MRPQNTAVILTKGEKSTLCESFKVSLSGDAVQRTVGPPICSYPWSAVETPNEVFDHGNFRSELANFLSRPSDHPPPPSAGSQNMVAMLTAILQGMHCAADVPRITKRVHDHVGWPLPKHRWRRSSLWLFIKITIQMSLDRSPLECASYKQFILFFLCTLSRNANDADPYSDLHLMSCKILRRLKKLGSSTPDWLSEMALKTCGCLQSTLDTRFRKPNARPTPFQNPSQDELTRDIQLSLLHSREYIRDALANPGHKPVPVATPFHPCHRRRGTIEDFLSSNGTFFEQAYAADPQATLYDVEQSVEQGIDDWFACVADVDEACAELGILMDKYMKEAKSMRHMNLETISIAILTAIELFVVLDKLVVKEVPMLAEYSPEIPNAFLEMLRLRKTTSLHRLSRAYQYLSARQSRSRPEWSVLSDEFTEDSFAVRYYDQSPHLQRLRDRIEEEATQKASGHVSLRQEGAGVSQSPLPSSLIDAKVVVFELQCPACLRIWRSAIPQILIAYSDYLPSLAQGPRERSVLLADTPGLQPYSIEHQGPNLSVGIRLAYLFASDLESRQFQSGPTLRYALKYDKFGSDSSWRGIAHTSLPKLMWENGVLGMTRTLPCMMYTSRTSNDILAAQADCPANHSLDEFIAFGHLEGGGSLQWLNILQGLRSRTLNLRRNEVHYLLSQAAFQVGPLDLNTGAWVWHQELQDASFCDALLDELDSLFMDVGAYSIDGAIMNTISLLLTRVLAATPSDGVSERAITLLRNVRRKTFKWVEELSYNLTMAPTNKKRTHLLFDVAATCRSTFDVDAATLRRLYHSAEDVDALLSCALLIYTLCPKRMSSSLMSSTLNTHLL